MSIADEIERLHALHQAGAINDREFAEAKAKLLGGATENPANPGFTQTPYTKSHINSLRRSRNDRWLGGICGGLASFTYVESWVWRLVFFLTMVCGGFGLFAYLVAWVFIPEEESPATQLPY